MNNSEVKWHYLEPETNLPARIEETKKKHYREPKPSVVVHWGIASQTKKLEAIYRDQQEKIHSLIGAGTCSCGLQIEDEFVSLPLAVVTSPHHRNHITLQPEVPVFRGLVGKRLFALNSVQTPIDKIWDELVTRFVSMEYQGYLFTPVTWTVSQITDSETRN